VCVGAAAPSACGQSQSGFTYNGINLTSYQASEYLNSGEAASTIRATGANYTAVMETQYVQTYTSTTIAPETTSSPGYNNQYSLSPTDAAVVSAIQSLQAQGLTVSLKPQVDSIDGVFRGSLAPTDVAAWFASYQTFILHYAQIASQNNVGMLVIGTELKSLTVSTYKSYWETMITQLRTQYPNLTLAYAANATGAGDEFTSVSFWADIDIIGVDGYFPLTNQTDPSIAALVAAWTNNKSGFNSVAALKNLQSQYSKPLIFTEIGYVSVSGTNEQPYASLTGTYDGTEQEDCYEAFFEVFSQQTAWMKGAFWWDWTVSPPSAGDTGYSSQNKPAGNVTMPKWFNNTTPGFTIAPSNSTLSTGQGLSTTDTIAITPQGGFSGVVSLAASGLPSGVTATFANGTATGTQVLTLSASNATGAAGPVAVTITGTSGSVTATTTVAFTVTISPVFALSASSPSVQVAEGGITTDTITVTPSNGFSAAVTLSVSGLPTGVTGTFATNPATSTSVLTLSANSAAPLAGPVTVTISGTSGVLNASAMIALTVTPSPAFAIGGTPISIAPGATAFNTSTISITPTNGFTGTVALSCAISPVAASDPATCAFSPASVTLVGTSAQASVLTVTTTPAGSSMNQGRPVFWPSAGGTVLALTLLFVHPRRRRGLQALLGALVLLLSAGLISCSANGTNTSSGGGNPGTTGGNYTVTITGTSGAVTATGSITLAVQ